MKGLLPRSATIGFGLAFAVLLINAGISYLNTRQLMENNQAVAQSHEVLAELEAALSSMGDAETGQRGYLITAQESYLDPYRDAMGRFRRHIGRLKELNTSNSAQQSRVALLEQKANAKFKELNQTIVLMQQKDKGFAAAREVVITDVGKNLMDGIRDVLGELKQQETEQLNARAEDSRRSFVAAIVAGLLTALTGLAMVALAYFMVGRELATRSRAEVQLREQGEWLRVTLRSIGDAVIATDTRGAVTFLNPVAQALTAWSQAEAQGQPLENVFRIIHEETRNVIEHPVGRVLREGAAMGLANHTVLVARDGQERPIEDSAAPIKDDRGAVLGVILVFHDVTEQRRAERAGLYLGAIVESSSDAIIGKTLDGIIVSWNKGAQKLYGYTADEMIGQPLTLLLPPEHRDELPAIMERVKRGEHIEHFETVRMTKDGVRLSVSLNISPIRDRDGRIIGASKIARDISRVKQAEAELLAASKAKDDFLAMLAHELRNPLAPLLNGLHILRLSGADAPTVDQARSMMERQTKHLVRLVDELLDVSRMTRGKIQLRLERVDLVQLALTTVEDRRSLLEQAGLTVQLEVPQTPVWVKGDATRLAQVLHNLLDNAAKYSTGGSVTVRVEADLTRAHAILSVRDTGIGIEPEMLPRLFDIFTQADRSLDRSKGGLGLGLALVKGLVQLHDGEIHAASEGLGLGAEFIVHFPLQAEPAALTRMPTALRPSERRLRILVVEDNRDAAESMRMLLELLGHEVMVAYSGPEGVKAAGERRPDVVLCDLGLPGMDGYRVASELRRNPATTKACLIAVTGYGQDEDRRRSRNAGFDYHLTKPVDPADLQPLLSHRR